MPGKMAELELNNNELRCMIHALRGSIGTYPEWANAGTRGLMDLVREQVLDKVEATLNRGSARLVKVRQEQTETGIVIIEA